VIDALGQGGFGFVVSAFDPELDRKVAIKLLRPEIHASCGAAEARVRLLREAQALARLSHPNVVTVHEVGTVQDDVFIAMEFVEGRTLSLWLVEDQPGDSQILEVFLAAGDGIAAAHRAGLVHRDFKPDNVMIGNDGRVRVLDFGLARPALALDESRDGVSAVTDLVSGRRELHADLTRAGAIMGTPAYMAPEQHLGKNVDARTDQFRTSRRWSRWRRSRLAVPT
jgi:serine/threonine protein kinase